MWKLISILIWKQNAACYLEIIYCKTWSWLFRIQSYRIAMLLLFLSLIFCQAKTKIYMVDTEESQPSNTLEPAQGNFNWTSLLNLFLFYLPFSNGSQLFLWSRSLLENWKWKTCSSWQRLPLWKGDTVSCKNF